MLAAKKTSTEGAPLSGLPVHVAETDSPSPSHSEDTGECCRVCGETNAKMHYSVLACLGCKGFFRRALKKADQFECHNDHRCVINKDARTSCRSCRLKKCLEVGMDPKFVRPDRDFTGRQRPVSARPPRPPPRHEEERANNERIRISQEDWMKRLNVETKTMLMHLLNIEAKIAKGDTSTDAEQLYPLQVGTLRELIEDPAKLKGKRSEMRYEPYRMANNKELAAIAYRRLIAAIDWVEFLAEHMGKLSVDDRIALVKSCFAPLMVFKWAARTAEVADDPNVLCLCNFAYVPRDINSVYTDTYHLGNGLVDRTLNELVAPYRQLELKEEEIVCLSAIIVLNPHARDLSEDAATKVIELRNKIQDTLFTVIKESRSKELASTQFGNILLSLPTVTLLANAMCENLQFAQTFSASPIPLLTSLFGCFPVEPFTETEEEDALRRLEERKKTVVLVDKATQTDLTSRSLKRRVPASFTSPVEDESTPCQDFRLLRPPNAYTLAEMFDDIQQEASSFELTASSSTPNFAPKVTCIEASSITLPRPPPPSRVTSNGIQRTFSNPICTMAPPDESFPATSQPPPHPGLSSRPPAWFPAPMQTTAPSNPSTSSFSHFPPPMQSFPQRGLHPPSLHHLSTGPPTTIEDVMEYISAASPPLVPRQIR